MSSAGGATLIAKVHKLLAKAEATDNANEAEAFSAKAAALIAEHRLDPDRLAADGPGEFGLRRVPVGRGAYVRARLALLQAVAEAHDAAMVWEPGPDGAVATIAGFVDDLAAIVVLYESLHVQAAGQMSRVVRRTGAATQRWRRSFLFGFAARVTECLVDVRRRAEDDAESSGRSGLPQRLARSEHVGDFARVAFGRVVTANAPRPAQRDGWDDGHRAAGRADLGRARIARRPALGAGGGS